MLQDSVISAMIEGANYDSDSSSSLKEQVLRLQSLIAYLLQKMRNSGWLSKCNPAKPIARLSKLCDASN
jgi:hypothetical protein